MSCDADWWFLVQAVAALALVVMVQRWWGYLAAIALCAALLLILFVGCGSGEAPNCG